MRALVVGLVLVLCAGATLSAEAKAPTYAQQAAKAASAGKLLLADFYTDWCYWCQQLDKQVYPDERVSQLIDKYFVLAKVNAEEDTATASKYKINAYPTLVIVDTDGMVLKRITGFEKPELFAADLEEAVELQKLRDEGQQIKKELAAGTPADAAEKEARLGYILLRLGDDKGATEWLNKAKAAGVDTPDLQLNLALATQTSIELVEALDKWVVANPESPRLWEATYDLGLAQSKVRQWTEALSSMKQVVAGAPESVWGLRAATLVKPLEQRVTEQNQPPPQPSMGGG